MIQHLFFLCIFFSFFNFSFEQEERERVQTRVKDECHVRHHTSHLLLLRGGRRISSKESFGELCDSHVVCIEDVQAIQGETGADSQGPDQDLIDQWRATFWKVVRDDAVQAQVTVEGQYHTQYQVHIRVRLSKQRKGQGRDSGNREQALVGPVIRAVDLGLFLDLARHR